MYETYSRYLYEYVKEQFPLMLDKLDSLLAALSVLQLSLDRLLQAVLFFGLLFFAFKFIRSRWLTVC